MINKNLGVVVPVGSLRSSPESFVGEFADLPAFASLCAKLGLSLIQLLPVNDTGTESSPYSALSAFALNPIYLRIQALPELKDDKSFTRETEALSFQFSKLTRYPYEKIYRAKIAILREVFKKNRKSIEKKFEKGGILASWVIENPWIKEYAVYKRLKEAHGGKSWRDWEAENGRDYRHVSPANIETLWQDKNFIDDNLFYAWLQYNLDAQLKQAAENLRSQGIMLEGDLPILLNEDSCDVWAHSDYFHQELSAGAPPDMFTPDGQNWGFPTYNWDALSAKGYDWWEKRLKVAQKYFSAYRIDHVLGFFRIWAAVRSDYSSALGRFIPYLPLERKDLEALGWDSGRIRWVSRSHVPTGEIWDALKAAGLKDDACKNEVEKLCSTALERIGKEELWLFKDSIKGEKDIQALPLSQASRNYLVQAWHNRLLLEYEEGHYVSTWYYRNSRAYASLSAEEKVKLDALLEEKRLASEKVWESEGRKILKALCASSTMLPCAEDLGAVPACVPKVLKELKILGLRVVRWTKAYGEKGEPYIPFEDYPELSVCTSSVHDSSTLREWWEKEADQEEFCSFLGLPTLSRVYNPGVAKYILQKIAGSASRFCVFPVQDLLHLSPEWYADDPARERINVPGTYNDFNWTYRLPATISEIAKDAIFCEAVRGLSQGKPGKKRSK